MDAETSVAKDWRSALRRLFAATSPSEGTTLTTVRETLEQRVSTKLPDSLIAFLDLMTIDPDSAVRLSEFRWLAIDEIWAAWEQHAQLAIGTEEVPADIAGEFDDRIRRPTHHRGRVPIAEFNGDVWICLDYAPTTSGVAGQVIQLDPEGLSWCWLAPSFDQLLEDIANGRVLGPDTENSCDHDIEYQ